MTQTVTLQAPTLIGALLPATADRRTALLRQIGLALIGSLVMIAAAKIKVPFWPVPMTLQTLAVFGIGAAFGARLGAATILLYIAYGVAGLPVFTNTPPVAAGPLYLVGPTGGFLLGFVVAAAIAGWSAMRGASWLRLVGGLVLAELAMMALGFGWLALGAQMANGASGIGFAKAFQFGVQPFLLGDALKLALAASLVGAGWSMIGRRGR